MSSLSEALKKVANFGENLDEAESFAVFDEIMSGAADTLHLADFLTALKMKGETVAEIVGAARAMRRRAHFIDGGAKTCVDTCGTGGDGLNTFNISTTSAFIAAGAGVCVAKHGNRAATSKCGSGDVLAALGFNLDVSPSVMEHCLQTQNIAFLFAPKMHPAMKYAGPVRRALGFRTIFNLLGPLLNPAGAKGQLVGVFDTLHTEIMANALSSLGVRRAFVVHSADGMDEISACAPTRISELRDGSVKTYTFNPQRYIEKMGAFSALCGGDPAFNAAKTLAVLKGEITDAARDTCLLNAAAAIVAGGVADNFADAFRLAEKSLSSGAALCKLETLVKFSNQERA